MQLEMDFDINYASPGVLEKNCAKRTIAGIVICIHVAAHVQIVKV